MVLLNHAHDAGDWFSRRAVACGPTCMAYNNPAVVVIEYTHLVPAALQGPAISLQVRGHTPCVLLDASRNEGACTTRLQTRPCQLLRNAGCVDE